MRDERLHPRLRLGAQLFLAYMENVFPLLLLESVIESEFGVNNKNKTRGETVLEEVLDKNVGSKLQEQWLNIIKDGGENDGNKSDFGRNDNT